MKQCDDDDHGAEAQSSSGSYGFRIERQGRVLVILTDEHRNSIDPNVVALAKDASCWSTMLSTQQKNWRKPSQGWGHSSYDQAIQVAEMARVKRLAMTTTTLTTMMIFCSNRKTCQERFKECILAKEGMELEM